MFYLGPPLAKKGSYTSSSLLALLLLGRIHQLRWQGTYCPLYQAEAYGSCPLIPFNMLDCALDLAMAFWLIFS